jgi:hypothetical protein
MMELMMSPWLPTKSSLASIPDHSMKLQQDRYLFPCLIFYNINQDHIGSSFVFRYHSPAGEAGSLIDQIPWLVQSDLDVICLCEQNGSALSKTLMTIADAVCNITRTQGATEACMLDHDMAPLTKDGSQKNK